MALFFFVGVQILNVPAAKLLVMVFLFGSLVPLFSWMQRTWQGTLNMLPAYKAVVQMRDRFYEAEEALAPARVDPLELKTGVEFRRVSFSYTKEDPLYVLNEIDLVLAARETTVILGPSGGGKSTFRGSANRPVDPGFRADPD